MYKYTYNAFNYCIVMPRGKYLGYSVFGCNTLVCKLIFGTETTIIELHIFVGADSQNKIIFLYHASLFTDKTLRNS